MQCFSYSYIFKSIKLFLYLQNLANRLDLVLQYRSVFLLILSTHLKDSEAVARRCSIKKVFLKISQNLQENTFARVSFLIKIQALVQVISCEFCEISKNTFFYRTPPVATSDDCLQEFFLPQKLLPLKMIISENLDFKA